jgi:hypothetical protein
VPRSLVLHIPYFARLKSFETDASHSRADNGTIFLSPDCTMVSLKWARLPVEPLGYAKAVADWKTEYARRFSDYTKAGFSPIPVEAPKLLTPDARARLFDTRWAPEICGLAVGKPVTDGGGTHEGRRASNAVDGNAADPDRSSWVVTPPFPRWMSIDLEEPTTIARVQVCLPPEDGNSVRLKVEVSADAKDWRPVGGCGIAAASSGTSVNFAPAITRHVRVTFLSASPGSTLRVTEIRVFDR